MSYGTHTRARYLEADVINRSPEWLVPLMYEHLLASLRRADVQIEVGDVEGRAESLSKANGIVLELAGCLDEEKGGDLVPQLRALYSFISGEILRVGRTADRAVLARLSGLIEELHEAWVQAAEQVAPRGQSSSTLRMVASA